MWLLAALTTVLVLWTAVVLAGDWRARAGGPGAAGPVLERHGLVVRLPAAAAMPHSDFVPGDGSAMSAKVLRRRPERLNEA